jgi:hypothetical protein
MSDPLVREQQILDVLHEVPAERWGEVLSFIRSLAAGPRQPAPEKPPLTAAGLLESGLIGMWAGRTDLGETREFARRLREQAQTRRRLE